MHRYGDLQESLSGRRSTTLENAPSKFSGVLNADNTAAAYSVQHKLRQRSESRKIRRRESDRTIPATMLGIRKETKRRQEYREQKRKQAEREEQKKRETILRERMLRRMEDSKAIRAHHNTSLHKRGIVSHPSKNDRNLYTQEGPTSIVPGRTKNITTKEPAVPVVVPTRRDVFRRLAVGNGPKSVGPGSTAAKYQPQQPTGTHDGTESIISEMSQASTLLHEPSFNIVNRQIAGVHPKTVKQDELLFDESPLRDSVHRFLDRNKPAYNPAALASVSKSGHIVDADFFNQATKPMARVKPRISHFEVMKPSTTSSVSDVTASLCKNDTVREHRAGGRKGSRRRALPAVRAPPGWKDSDTMSVFSEPAIVSRRRAKVVRANDKAEEELQQALSRLDSTLKELRQKSSVGEARRYVSEEASSSSTLERTQPSFAYQTPAPMPDWGSHQWQRLQHVPTAAGGDHAQTVICQGEVKQGLPQIKIQEKPSASRATRPPAQLLPKPVVRHPLQKPLVPKRDKAEAEFQFRRRRIGR